MKMTFNEVPLGARFEFRGRRYEKVALSMARDEDRFGNVFQDYTEVVADCHLTGQTAEGGQPGWRRPMRRA